VLLTKKPVVYSDLCSDLNLLKFVLLIRYGNKKPQEYAMND